MSDLEKKNISFSSPTEEDEDLKKDSMKKWTDDRMKLVNWRPFIGSLAMNLELVPVVDHRCQTACTDGKRIFFNPHFLSNLSSDERLTILAHEIWHCGLSHFMREQGRIEEHKMWNYAIDHEVNAILLEDGFAIPNSAVLYKEHIGESAETVFELIKSGNLEMKGQCLDEHPNSPPQDDCDIGSDGLDGWGTIKINNNGDIDAKIDADFKPRRDDDVWKEWNTKMMAAAQQCKDKGIDLGTYERHLHELFDSRIHWKEILRQYLTRMFCNTRKWLPPNRRYVYKRMYFPSLRKQKQLNIVIAIDTSGSTSGDIIKTFVSEVYAILNSFHAYKIRLIQCDWEVNQDTIYDASNPFVPEKFKLSGGGGTNFIPVFELLDDCQEPPSVLLYLTDGFGSAPTKSPPYPVIWGLIKGGSKPAKWGESIKIELGENAQ